MIKKKLVKGQIKKQLIMWILALAVLILLLYWSTMPINNITNLLNKLT